MDTIMEAKDVEPKFHIPKLTLFLANMEANVTVTASITAMTPLSCSAQMATVMFSPVLQEQEMEVMTAINMEGIMDATISAL